MDARKSPTTIPQMLMNPMVERTTYILHVVLFDTQATDCEIKVQTLVVPTDPRHPKSSSSHTFHVRIDVWNPLKP